MLQEVPGNNRPGSRETGLEVWKREHWWGRVWHLCLPTKSGVSERLNSIKTDLTWGLICMLSDEVFRVKKWVCGKWGYKKRIVRLFILGSERKRENPK